MYVVGKLQLGELSSLPLTIYTWFEGYLGSPKLMRIEIEGPELESVNFEEILDILRSLTGVFRFKNPAL